MLVTRLVAVAVGGAFFLRQRRAAFPLYDPSFARRRLFWAAAVAGIIVSGSLMGAIFVGQQYLQDVLGCRPGGPGWRRAPPTCREISAGRSCSRSWVPC